MNNAHHYEVDLVWTSDRKGTISSPVLNSSIEVATPPEFPKGIPGIWSPEHLLVAAVNSCYMTTFLAIAENFKLAFESLDCKAVGLLEQPEGKYLITTVLLKPVLVINDEHNAEKAMRVLEKTEKACLISNSIKANIKLDAVVKVSHN
ncbi:OsmC family protein [Sediminibacterium sp.]|uniref:OsmC family protein n=1 Tax=Sediminibacterium sp. TaxID=1917865 RepID=UPI0025D4608A|nr:OsmC family protein [Sediminibacterium sp.]MBT9484802.1 OsmC family protein [Sediminibacterium sp.]